MEEARRTVGDDIEEMREYLHQWDSMAEELALLSKKYPMVCPELEKIVHAGVFHWNYCVPFMELKKQEWEQKRQAEEERDREIHEELARIEQEEIKKAKARKKKKNKKKKI